ncbi:hypothetical protein DPMN_039282 [Dreissena polymorpha]|uniref:Uncharacterized protein n=1 Tax=Dreissena polymorpha TaxID=45954 RepID=A0A9D4RRJ2_DREPO|nr:hypothetical protein DPMN_039282 [Dreissena polymorpha]
MASKQGKTVQNPQKTKETDKGNSNAKELDDNKRNRSEVSSSSELETSLAEAPINQKQKKKKKNEQLSDTSIDCIDELDTEEPNVSCFKKELENVLKQMRQINSKLERLDGSMNRVNGKLEHVVMKGDDSLRETFKELIKEMKDDLLKSVINKIEIVESKFFEKEQECDVLRTLLKTMESKVNDKDKANDRLEQMVKKQEEKLKKLENETEQYSRRNNIKIRGIQDTDAKETAIDSAKKSVKFLNEKGIVNLSLSDIDIAHRLPNPLNKNRDIIVRFVSRLTRETVMSNRRKLKSTGVFINEHLTRLNLHVLMCIKKKDE